MTAQTLSARTLKDLADMARKRGVHGWRSMRKNQLVRALLKITSQRATVATSKSPAKKSVRGTRTALNQRNGQEQRRSAVTRSVSGRAASRSNPRIAKRLEQAKVRLMRAKILATSAVDGRDGTPAKDRLVVMVRGPFWLHAYWELTPAGVVRAQAALGELWHTAKPMLRLLEVSSAGSSTAAERVRRDVPIHGGVTNWYIDVSDPPKTYRMEIGYLAANGRFFSLARSNTVSTPAQASSEKLDNHWTDVVENCDKIYAMSGGYSSEVNSNELQEVLEERLRRPMGGTVNHRYNVGAEGAAAAKSVDALPCRSRDGHSWSDSCRRTGDAARRRDQTPSRWQLQRAARSSQSPPGHSAGGQRQRWQFAAHHCAGGGTEHEGDGADRSRTKQLSLDAMAIDGISERAHEIRRSTLCACPCPRVE